MIFWLIVISAVIVVCITLGFVIMSYLNKKYPTNDPNKFRNKFPNPFNSDDYWWYYR